LRIKTIAKILNYLLGIILLILGILCFIFIDDFSKMYDIKLLTIQGKTEMRVISGFSFVVGYLLLYFTRVSKNQKQVLFATMTISFYFLFARIIGLYIDGFSQKLTYYELLFELIGFIFIYIIYRKLDNKTLEKNK
jgi:uncharacterized protein YjeT (DUF2065 family)